mmetsp:Transcript_16768/g.24443  ORF Transcript_16768/g.24443 Transcript_16768/m.24443 type:complete len:107 (-) Transcript_16768:569-889(-)
MRAYPLEEVFELVTHGLGDFDALGPGRKACCSNEKQPLLPGRAIDMLRSSPKSLCHSWTEQRCLSKTASRISRRRSRRCGGSEIDMATMSTSQPKMTFWEDQVCKR